MIKQTIQKGVILGLSFSLTMVLSAFTYAVWTGLSAENGDTLNASKWNELVNKVDGIFTDGSGNVGVGTQTPIETFHVAGSIKVDSCSSDMELWAGWCMEKTDRDSRTRVSALNTCSTDGKVICPIDPIFACDSQNGANCAWTDQAGEERWAGGNNPSTGDGGSYLLSPTIDGSNIYHSRGNEESYKFRCCKMLP